MAPLILYHKNCTDGFTSAWALWRKYGDEAEYMPVSHSQEPPDVEKRLVYMVDFAFPERASNEKLASQAEKLIIYDHHISAYRKLKGFPNAIFDMDESGASLTWKQTHGEDIPWLVYYVRANDLWQHEDPNVKFIACLIESYERTFENWEVLYEMLENDREEAIRIGESLFKYKRHLAQDIIHRTEMKIMLDGNFYPCVNSSCLQSEIGNILAEKHNNIGVVWAKSQGGKYIYSLRSIESAPDAEALAAKFGGGGHRNASGFISFDEPTTLSVE